MRIEVLVSTMNQKNIELVKKMNIKSDALIINQTNYDGIENYKFDNKKFTLINCNEVGLSKSRNKALANATGDICIIADDDVVYNDKYCEVVKSAYKKYYDADIIVFEVPTTNQERKQKKAIKNEYISYLKSGKISSFQITFKRKSLIDNNIKFDEMFGAGARYSCGEENILLFEALRNNLKIVRVIDEIGIVTHEESTWFKGYDEKFFRDKGAIFTRLTKRYSLAWIVQYAIRKYKIYYNNISFSNALKYMLKGRKEFLLFKYER